MGDALGAAVEFWNREEIKCVWQVKNTYIGRIIIFQLISSQLQKNACCLFPALVFSSCTIEKCFLSLRRDAKNLLPILLAYRLKMLHKLIV